ncbi:MAG TPA: c-type cytochrome [Gemmatimonadales bacterium]|nr:c-type cytochrome [Gemmatimonadales bacterium]
MLGESKSCRSSGAILLLGALGLGLAACSRTPAFPGRPPAGGEVPDPRLVLAFEPLYAANCAGCHGDRGKGGAAIGLAAPGYLAIAPDAEIHPAIAAGRPGTAMPAFSHGSGGMLSDAQVDVLVRGIRAWAPPGTGPQPGAPPYVADGPGDPKRGGHVFQERCGTCHGADGRGGRGGNSIVDGSFLALVSDASLRTTVIAGRPDLGSPGWRETPGAPLSAQDVSDVVAWLASHRAPFPGQPYPNAQAVVRQP